MTSPKTSRADRTPLLAALGRFDEAASAAWGAAICWDDNFPAKRLAEVRTV